MDFRLPIPKNWQDFESICHKLWTEIWNDHNSKKNGRQGQAQNGIDVFGKPIRSKTYHGVQCKDKDGRLGSLLTRQELEIEATKAKGFTPQISSFTLATTAPRDQDIQEYYRNLTEDSIFPFEVNVWSWDDIEAEIAYRPIILKHYYPQFNGLTENSGSIKLNRLSTKDHLDAYFSRPGLKEKISKKFKSYLQPLIYELADNSYKYGKGSEFKIDIEGRKISLTDNGEEFNPLEKLNPLMVNSFGNIGSFVLHTFIKRFENGIKAEYKREESKNILSFEADETILQIDDDEHYEINIDLMMIYGRESAYGLVQYLPEDKKEIIVNVEEIGALSTFVQFTQEALNKISNDQILTLSLPRHEYLNDIPNWFNDERLRIKSR